MNTEVCVSGGGGEHGETGRCIIKQQMYKTLSEMIIPGHYKVTGR